METRRPRRVVDQPAAAWARPHQRVARAVRSPDAVRTRLQLKPPLAPTVRGSGHDHVRTLSQPCSHLVATVFYSVVQTKLSIGTFKKR